MKKTILVNGIIAGFISSSLFIGLMLLGKADHEMKHGMIYGFSLMILAFAFIFVATKIVRDKYQNGSISFGKAFRIGFYITLIASTIYVLVWLIDYYFFIPDFAEKYAARMIENLKASGASAPEITRRTAEMVKFSDMYKNPLFNALITYTEILPVGLLISLLSAFTLKRKLNSAASGS